MNFAEILVLALLLDAAMGEPAWIWSRVSHPAVIMGRVIGWADGRFNKGAARRLKGAALTGALCLAGGAMGAGLAALPGGWAVQLVLAAILLAQQSLFTHVREVSRALQRSLSEGRVAVAQIVGRDTSELDASGVSRAAIESAAENLSDGVIAPAFWFLIFGLPGMLIYKAVNTADSMIGYRTPRHREFGWASARLDDVLNWVPARLTAVITALVAGRIGDLPAIARDARLHRSPNAGWPEAGFARALGVALSGPRSYGGQMQDFPYVNRKGARDLGAGDIDRASRLLWRVWAAFAVLVLVAAVLA